LRSRPRDPRARRRRVVRLSPLAVLALLYTGLALLGTLLLMLPWSTVVAIGWADAAFTAISAVTVTGLVTVDTGGHFSLLGQAVILLLIQLGGLGIMSFAVMVLALLGHPLRLRHRIMLKEDLNQTSFDELGRLIWAILKLVVVCESLGIALLAIRFVPEEGWATGLWLAFFHSISAFNNAGFALFADSLEGFAADPLTSLTIALLFIIGGLGFTVLSDLGEHRQWRRLSVHSKLMLSGSVGLAVLGLVLFLLLEWNNPATLGPLDPAARLLAAFFQSVTRTAGFSSVDIAALEDSTALMLISLMLIGGGSTSTAGGIKVTTFMVLLLATLAFLRRRPEVNAFGRRLPHEDILKVLALTVISLLVVMTGLFLMTLTHEAPFLDIAFEVASAFATTGLSRGLTAELDGLGYAVIGVLMLIGRIGPLALGFVLATAAASYIRHPEGRVYLG